MEITPLEFNPGTSYSFQNGQTTQHDSLLFGFLRVICIDEILKNPPLLTIRSNNKNLVQSQNLNLFQFLLLSLKSGFHFFMRPMLLTLLISHPSFIANNGTLKFSLSISNLSLNFWPC